MTPLEAAERSVGVGSAASSGGTRQTSPPLATSLGEPSQCLTDNSLSPLRGLAATEPSPGVLS